MKSTVADRPSVELAPLVIHEIHLVGSRCGPFKQALAALESGAVSVAPLVSDRFALGDAARALERAAEPRGLESPDPGRPMTSSLTN